MKPGYILILVICGIVVFSVCFWVISRFRRRVSQLRNYVNISLGMPEQQMLSIMGPGYNRSLLRDGTVRYEWHISGVSSGFINDGFVTMAHDEGSKVDILCDRGVVIEVIPFNVN